MTYFVSGLGRTSCRIHPTRKRPQTPELRSETTYETVAQDGQGSQSCHQRFSLEPPDSEQLGDDGPAKLVVNYVAHVSPQVPGGRTYDGLRWWSFVSRAHQHFDTSHCIRFPICHHESGLARLWWVSHPGSRNTVERCIGSCSAGYCSKHARLTVTIFEHSEFF